MLGSGIARLSLLILPALLVAGCSTRSAPVVSSAVQGASGSVYGGQQPITGATIQLYAVGDSGDGSAATPLLTRTVTTDAHGNFLITGLYTCPSASALVYITGTGGSPSVGVSNPQIALMAALGPCSGLTPSTFININEITSVAAVYALAPFMTSYTEIGSAASDAAGLASAFVTAGYFANPSSGSVPGAGLPSNYTVPLAQIDSLADLLAACINSSGGVSGDASICGNFFALTRPSGAPASTDALGALLNLAHHPTLNTAALYSLIPATSPFQPTLTTVPPDFSVRLLAASAFAVTPSSLSFSPAVVHFPQSLQTVTVTNGTSASVGITSASLLGVNASDFAVVSTTGSDCGASVPANSTCTFHLSFTPSAPGARTAYFVVGNASANPSFAVALSGSGVSDAAGPATLAPAGLTFTQYDAPQALTLTNSGVTPLSIASIQISTTFYSQTNHCGASLPALSSCTINVLALGFGDPSATLTVFDDATAGPQTASLSFTGAGLVDYADGVDFGHWAAGTVGSNSLQIDGTGDSGTLHFTLSGANATDFSFAQGSSLLSTTCNYNYPFGSPCLLNLFYRPTAHLSSIAAVNVTGIGQFPIFGTGDAPGLDFDVYQSPTQADHTTNYTRPIKTFALGTSPVGAPVSYSFTVQNTGAISPLMLNAPVVSGPNAADFTATAPACASGCLPSVTFTPSASGFRTATLTYTDSTNTVTRTFTLTGSGTPSAPVLTASTNLIFSNTPSGTVGDSQTITVNAYQGDAIQATLASTYSGGPQPFVFTGPATCSSTPCTLSLAYAPSSASDDGATVYVTATDTTTQLSGSIQAYGQIAPIAYVDETPDSLTFAAQALNTVSAPQVLTFRNTGTTVLALTFSVTPRGNAPAPDYTVASHCPPSLAIGASCTVDVRFAPVSVRGTLDTYLVVHGVNVTRYISLSGTSY